MNPEIDVSQVRLETDRLILRPWEESDLDDFYAYASVDGVGQMAGWAPHRTREESREILANFIQEKKTLALVREGKVIGSLEIKQYDEEQFPELQDQRGRELSFVLAKDYWGQGLMPEAVQAVMRYLFEEEELDFLLCGHFPENQQSARVQEKCGFLPYKKIPYQTQMGEKKEVVANICWREDFLGGSGAKRKGKMDRRVYLGLRLFLFSLLLPLLGWALIDKNTGMTTDSPLWFPFVLANDGGLTDLWLFSKVINRETFDKLGFWKIVFIALPGAILNVLIMCTPSEWGSLWLSVFLDRCLFSALLPILLPLSIKAIRWRKHKEGD